MEMSRRQRFAAFVGGIFFCQVLVMEVWAGGQTVRGDPTGLPPLDFNKSFDSKNFGRFEKTFTTREFQTKVLNLPNYYGKLDKLKLTEWEYSRTHQYSKTPEVLDFKEMKFRDAGERWAKNVGLRDDQEASIKREPVRAKEANTDKPDVASPVYHRIPELPRGQDFKKLINQGSKPAPVKTGRGFRARELSPTPQESPGP
jgi:hypothetical protein